MARKLTLLKTRLRGVEVLEQRCYLSASPQEVGLVPDYSSPSTILPDSLTTPESQGAYDVAIRVQATDVEGNPLTQVHAGEDFILRIYVQDTSPRGDGVFGSYLDINYDSKLAKATGPIQFAFPNGRSGVISLGRIDDAGAFAGIAFGDTSVRLLLSLPMRARHEGAMTLAAQPSHVPGSYTLLYGFNDPIASSHIDFQPTVLTILPAPLELAPDDDPGYITPASEISPYYSPKNTPPRMEADPPAATIPARPDNVYLPVNLILDLPVNLIVDRPTPIDDVVGERNLTDIVDIPVTMRNEPGETIAEGICDLDAADYAVKECETYLRLATETENRTADLLAIGVSNGELVAEIERLELTLRVADFTIFVGQLYETMLANLKSGLAGRINADAVFAAFSSDDVDRQAPEITGAIQAATDRLKAARPLTPNARIESELAWESDSLGTHNSVVQAIAIPPRQILPVEWKLGPATRRPNANPTTDDSALNGALEIRPTALPPVNLSAPRPK